MRLLRRGPPRIYVDQFGPSNFLSCAGLTFSRCVNDDLFQPVANSFFHGGIDLSGMLGNQIKANQI